MKSKLLVAAGTAIAVGMLTIALPVFAQTDTAATNNNQATEQNGQFSKFRENMRENMQERMQNRTPLTFDEAKARMTENLTNGQTRAQQQLNDLYSGELETRIKTHLETATSYLEKVQNAGSEEELNAIREEMHEQMEALRESGDLPLGMGQGMGGKMGRGMHGFGGPQAGTTAE